MYTLFSFNPIMLHLFIYGSVIIIFILVIHIYWKFIRPTKRIYDILRGQGVPSEPFIPIIGQLPEIRAHRQKDQTLEYQQNLTKKHGFIYLYCFGPYSRLAIQDLDLIADVLDRKNDQNYFKTDQFNVHFKSLIGLNGLALINGTKHSRASKMLNPAFHFSNLQSMISIMTDQTIKTIATLLQSSST